MANVNAAPALPLLMQLIERWAGNNQIEALNADTPVEPSIWVDPDRTLKMQEKQRILRDAKSAAPLANALDEYSRTGIDQAFTPEEIAAGYDVKLDPQSQAQAGIKDLYRQKQTIAGIAPKIQRGEEVDGTSLANLVVGNKEGQATLAKLLDLGKYNDEMKTKRGNQAWINASAELTSDPKLSALARAAQRGATPKDLETMAGIYGLNPVELKTVEAGDANGNDVKYVFNPRTGQTQGTVGMPQQARRNATRISVNPIIQQEGAFARGVGEANAKQYAAAIEARQNATNALQSLSELKTALKKAPSGITAPAQYQAGRVISPNSDTVAAYEIARNKQQELALNLLQNFKGAMSDKELKFVEEMSINPTMNRKSQAELIRISEARYKNAINKADTLIKSVEADPVRSNINRTLSDNAPKFTGQTPRTASDYLKAKGLR